MLNLGVKNIFEELSYSPPVLAFIHKTIKAPHSRAIRRLDRFCPALPSSFLFLVFAWKDQMQNLSHNEWPGRCWKKNEWSACNQNRRRGHGAAPAVTFQ